MRPAERARGAPSDGSRGPPDGVSPMAALLVLLAFAAVPGLSTIPTQSPSGHTVGRVGDVQVQTFCPWPRAIVPGWLPLTVTFDNTSDEEVSLEAVVQQGWRRARSASRPLELAAGERRTEHWLVPLGSAQHGQDVHLTVSTRDDTGVWTVFDDEHRSHLGEYHVVVAGAGEQPSGPLRHVRHDQLPSDWRAYTSLAFLVLDLREGEPAADVWDAVLAWVAAGGVVQVVGEPRGVALPVEERFRLGDEHDGSRWPRYRHGFGTIQVAGEVTPSDLPGFGVTSPYVSVAAADWNAPKDMLMAPGVLPPWLALVRTPIPGLQAIPVGWLSLVLVLAFLVMGPLQFTWLKRRGRPPAMLLVTTPLLGFGFALLVLGSSAATQGFGVQQAVTSIVWLDQGGRHAASLARRTVFSGSVFGTALRYGPGTVVLPLTTRGGHAGYHRDPVTGVLSGSWLPVRAPVDELLATSGPARQRLALERKGEDLSVVNALGADLLQLVVRDHDGRHHRFAGERLPDGGRAPLVPCAAPTGRLRFGPPAAVPLFLEEGFALAHLPETLPPGTYAALLDRSPFLDDGGVRRTTVSQRHVLVGALEASR